MSDRETVLTAIFARAGDRPVYGIDSKGHGGQFRPGDKKTDLWGVKVADLVQVCIGGEPWERLPTT